jgi:2-polyprenyl-3-methyl-5-hydroxy-6-metoxy-1,4-benzoquinol methylase
MSDYRDVNRAYWNDRVAAHAASEDYAVARFANDPAYLSEVVRFDRDRLGDVGGLDVVHLQCHIGTDTVSLARLGARVTGVDQSVPALETARALAASAGVEATFAESELYGAVEALGRERFDLVYTGVGALNWLPDVRRWAQVVATLLRPAGRLHIREGHPMMWSLDEARTDGLLVVAYPYFETAEPIVFEGEGGTYVTTDQVFTENLTHEWNHGLGEIITALLDAGMELTRLEEHTTVPWAALPGMIDTGGGEMQLPERPERLPMTYTLQARKRA